MNIKTWDQRIDEQPGSVVTRTLDVHYAMQAEIDELRAALLESKDVGLRLLTCRSLFSLARGEINAQRNVLEQALEALESWSRLAPDLALPEYADAITAIQEQLHEHN